MPGFGESRAEIPAQTPFRRRAPHGVMHIEAWNRAPAGVSRGSHVAPPSGVYSALAPASSAAIVRLAKMIARMADMQSTPSGMACTEIDSTSRPDGARMSLTVISLEEAGTPIWSPAGPYG